MHDVLICKLISKIPAHCCGAPCGLMHQEGRRLDDLLREFGDA
jgi:hypothetical protein